MRIRRGYGTCHITVTLVPITLVTKIELLLTSPPPPLPLHRYKVIWTPTSIDFFIDGEIAQSVTGKAGAGGTIPYLPGYVALILRPKTTQFIQDIGFNAQYMSYTLP